MRHAVLGCGILLAGVFAASASSKVRGRSAFAGFVRSVRHLGRVPAGAARPVAVTVVVAESAVPVLLLLLPVAGFVVATGLLAVFSVAIAAAVRRRERTPCRCFGVSATPVSGWHLPRNGMLAAAGVFGAVALLSEAGIGASWLDGGLHPAGVATAALAAVTLGAFVIFYDDIIELFANPGPA